MRNYDSIATGVLGIASVEATEPILNAVSSNPNDVVQIVVQILIGIATLVGMFRKKSK